MIRSEKERKWPLAELAAGKKVNKKTIPEEE